MRDYLLMFTHVVAEGVLIVRQKVALSADAFVVYFVDVRGQPFGAGSFIIAQDAEVRFDVSVEMTFETPIVHPSPSAVGACIQLFLLLLFAARRSRSRRTCHTVRLLLLTRRCGDRVSRSD